MDKFDLDTESESAHSTGKTALITGASAGLGAEFAHQLAAAGYNLVLVARREERLEQLAGSIQSKVHMKVDIISADLSCLDGIQEVISRVNQLPNLDMLVNNAGFGLAKKFLDAESDKELAQLQVHILAPVLLCRAVLPGMVARHRGSVINVSSMAGLIPIRSVLYGTSKSFLVNFSEALQDEVHKHNIKIQALCPGYTYTEFHDTPEYTRFNRETIPRFLWLTSRQVVADSLRDLQDGNVVCIPGSIYKFAGLLARNSLTAGLIRMSARYFLRKRYQDQDHSRR